jgi:hypothetical protein
MFLVDNLSNIEVIGQNLYNNYNFILFIIGLVLLVALIGCISLTIDLKNTSKTDISYSQNAKKSPQAGKIK